MEVVVYLFSISDDIHTSKLIGGIAEDATLKCKSIMLKHSRESTEEDFVRMTCFKTTDSNCIRCTSD